MHGIRCLTCSLLLLLAPIVRGDSHTAAVPNDAEAVARTFYAWVLGHPSTGIPAADELKQLQPLLSTALVDHLQAAALAQRDCERSAAADEKPLMLEGDLFVGSYEGASEVVLGAVSVDGEQADVSATLIYLDPRFALAHPHRTILWQDRLQLIRENGSWRVADIHPGTGDNLKATLASFIEQAGEECRRGR